MRWILLDNDRAGFGKTVNILLFAVSLIPVILLFYVVVNRTTLPFTLEWGEGAGVNQILRILGGETLYAEPDHRFAALVYTPLYYYLSAGLAWITGSALLGARLLSTLSAVGAAILIGSLVWKRSENGLASWLAGSLYLGCFALSDGYYDLARVDSLYVFVALITFVGVIKAKKPIEYFLVGILVAAGFYIKQSFLILFIPFLTALLIKKNRYFWPALIGSLAGILLPLIFINHATDGWFLYYIFQLPREHAISPVSAINFWIGDTIAPLSIAILFTTAYLLDNLGIHFDGNNFSKVFEGDNWVEPLLGAGFLLGTWSTRSTAGGGANNLMPLYAIIALGFGLGTDLLIRKSRQESGNGSVLVAGAILLQLTGLIYNPFNFIPTRDEIKYNRQIIEETANSEKILFVPYQSQLIQEGSGPAQIHIVNLFELTGYFGGEIRPEGVRIVNQIRENICGQAYSKIVFDQPVPWFDDQLALTYLLEEQDEDRDFRKSDQMDWQLGRDNTYFPLSGADQEQCLESINP